MCLFSSRQGVVGRRFCKFSFGTFDLTFVCFGIDFGPVRSLVALARYQTNPRAHALAATRQKSIIVTVAAHPFGISVKRCFVVRSEAEGKAQGIEVGDKISVIGGIAVTDNQQLTKLFKSTALPFKMRVVKGNGKAEVLHGACGGCGVGGTHICFYFSSPFLGLQSAMERSALCQICSKPQKRIASGPAKGGCAHAHPQRNVPQRTPFVACIARTADGRLSN